MFLRFRILCIRHFVINIINNIRTRFIISFYMICAVIYYSFYCIYVWLDPGTYMIARFMSFCKPGVTDEPEPVVSALTFPVDTKPWNTLGWRLQRYPCACGFYLWRCKVPTCFLAPLLENGSYIIFGLSHPRIFFFFFPWFYLNPRYPWSSYPFYSSLHPRVSSMSQHLPLTQFFLLAMNSTQAT